METIALVTDDTRTAAEVEADIVWLREHQRRLFRAAAGARIAALFAQPPQTLELAWKQINTLSSLVALLWLERKGALTLEQAAPQLDAALALFSGAIQPIRDAENAASALLDDAGTDEQMTPAERAAEIDAVTPEWPV